MRRASGFCYIILGISSMRARVCCRYCHTLHSFIFQNNIRLNAAKLSKPTLIWQWVQDWRNAGIAGMAFTDNVSIMHGSIGDPVLGIFTWGQPQSRIVEASITFKVCWKSTEYWYL